MSTDKIEYMSMDNFNVLIQNREEYELCKKMIINPKSFRLCYIHLPANERLHLKYAIINYLKNDSYMSSFSVKDLIEDLISAIQSGEAFSCMKKYIEPDILLIDDIQYLTNKPSTQEELYFLLKQRLESKKLTIFFSECDINLLSGTIKAELEELVNIAVKN